MKKIIASLIPVVLFYSVAMAQGYSATTAVELSSYVANTSISSISINVSALNASRIAISSNRTFTINPSASFPNASLIFNGRTGSGYGGAINSTGISNITFNVPVTISNNSISDDGGGIYLNGSSNIMIFNAPVNILYNIPGNLGGGIFLETASTITFNNSTTIHGNRTASSTPGSGYNGGGVYIYDGSHTISFSSQSIISSNTAYQGGGIYIRGGTLTINVSSNVIFTGNTASNAGNDIYNNGGTLNLNVTGNVYLGGGVEGTGTISKTGTGNVYFQAGSLTNFRGRFDITGGGVSFSTSVRISTMSVGANTSLTLDVDFLGSLTSVIYLSSITINAGTNTLYVNNVTSVTVSTSGASAIFYTNNANPGTFSNIYNVGTTTSNYTFLWQTSNLSGYDYMGVLSYGGGVLAMATPWNNFVLAYSTAASGSAIGALADNITASSPTDCNAFGSPTNNNITINGGGFTLNSAMISGLGFVFTNSSATFSNINFSSFSRSGNGGVITAANSRLIFTGNVNFVNNMTTGTTNSNGGGFYASGSTMTFTNAANFVSNVSSRGAHGGGFYANSSSITFNGAVFNLNVSSGHGGGFYATGKNSVINFNSLTTISGNIGTFGGGFYAGDNNADIVKIIFSGGPVNISSNTARGLGGGFVLFDASSVTFNSYTNISGNTGEDGG